MNEYLRQQKNRRAWLEQSILSRLPATCEELRIAIRVSWITVRKILERLAEHGRVVVHRGTPGDFKKPTIRYLLPEGAERPPIPVGREKDFVPVAPDTSVRRGMSGVIAGKPYRTGYRWGAGY